MKKIIFRTLYALLVLLISIILYLSTVGIETNRFNSQIISKIKTIEPNLEPKINKVSAKLDLLSFSLNARTVGANLVYRDKIIQLENIKTRISLKSIINNQFALSEIAISTKSILIKNLIGFLRQVYNEPKLLITEHLITGGYVVADLKLEFDESGNIKKSYKFNGYVNDAKFEILNKKFSKLNFNFQISDNEFLFDEVRLLINDKNVAIPEIKAIKFNEEFLVSGKLKTKDLIFRNDDLKNFTNNKFLKDNLKIISFDSENDFKIQIDKNFKLKNSSVNSIINLNYLELNNFLKLKRYFPNIKNNIELKNHKIQLEYIQNKMNISGSGDIFLQSKSDTINYKITRKNKSFYFDTNLKVTKNPFKIDILNYKKNEKSILKLYTKGKLSNDGLFFEKTQLSENKNIITISDLNLSENYQIYEIGNIKIDFLDKENLKNQIKLIKIDKNYKLIGKSLNLNQIISNLLESSNNTTNYFAKNFELLFDVEKIFLDKKNSAKNLKGFLILSNNEITELNLESEFLDKKKIKFTIKPNDINKKVTTLFSGNAKPLVDRYKFIKGFNEGSLDFTSVKENKKNNSSLKIYDFKLKELPVLTKLLTLASLQGIADLLSGEGIRFDEFEMNFTNENNLMKINEIYAIGPAISILMEGYVEKDNLISLRGTLVPATTINKTISSIPVLGSILVGKKTGEGVFGVSFKIKGPPGNLETTVNPIKTLTPRFITRTLEKIKNIK